MMRPGRRIASLLFLLPYLRRYAWRVTGASAALLVAAGLVLLLGQGVRHLIDHGFAGHDPATLNRAAAAMFLVVAALAVATYARFYLVSWLGERTAADLRRDVFNHVIGLSPSYFETARTGDVLSRMTADISVLQALIGSAISMAIRNVLLLAGALVMLVATSAKLAGVIVVVVPVVVVPLILFGRRERRLSRVAQDRVGDLGAYAEETINALATVQAFTHEAVDRSLFSLRVEQSVGAALRRIRTRAWLILVVILLGFGAITFSLWIGGRDVMAGRMSGGDLSAFVFYAVLLATSGATLSEVWGEMQRAAGAADRLIELLDEKPGIAAPPDAAAFPVPARGTIALENVRFRYPSRPETAALDGISFHVDPGETVALVGPSGAGKSTIFQLLLRFHDAESGVVRIDGVDVSRADPAALRSRVAVVAQDPAIFSANAWENIRYGRPDASNAEVEAAVEAASAQFLKALPEGMDTFLGEKGVRLSGGQRQRVAIARAILRNAPILLLDEATSALDAESEQAVQRALMALSRNRTTLVIAHRLATIRRADRIVVIEQGKIVAAGSHAALVREEGLYARLAALQFDMADAAG
jgi:ATP-binding cassette subfamily B protein